MATKQPSAVGIFDELEQAEKAIDDLRHAGFRADEIGIIGHVGTEQQTIPTPLEVMPGEENVEHGVIRGAVWGAIVGIVVIAAIPGLALAAGTGWWFEILGGAVLGAAAGGALFAFGSLIFTRPRARFYGKELEKGSFIVTVKNPARNEEAVTLLRHQGAVAEKESGA
jgi:Heat induced stress protein YflT domain